MNNNQYKLETLTLQSGHSLITPCPSCRCYTGGELPPPAHARAHTHTRNPPYTHGRTYIDTPSLTHLHRPTLIRTFTSSHTLTLARTHSFTRSLSLSLSLSLALALALSRVHTHTSHHHPPQVCRCVSSRLRRPSHQASTSYTQTSTSAHLPFPHHPTNTTHHHAQSLLSTLTHHPTPLSLP